MIYRSTPSTGSKEYVGNIAIVLIDYLKKSIRYDRVNMNNRISENGYDIKALENGRAKLTRQTPCWGKIQRGII